MKYNLSKYHSLTDNLENNYIQIIGSSVYTSLTSSDLVVMFIQYSRRDHSFLQVNTDDLVFCKVEELTHLLSNVLAVCNINIEFITYIQCIETNTYFISKSLLFRRQISSRKDFFERFLTDFGSFFDRTFESRINFEGEFWDPQLF